MKFNLGSLFLSLVTFTSCNSTPIDVITVKDTDEYVTVWKEDFVTDLSSGWGMASWGFDGNLSEFTPTMIQLDNSICEISIGLKKQPANTEYPNAPYWGGELFNENKTSQYGKWAVRMKSNSPKGVVTSFFLAHYEWNNDYTNLIESSEIDIEFAGRNDVIELAIHYSDKNGNLIHVTPVPKIKLEFDASKDFHLYEIEVTENHIRYFVDKKQVYEMNDKVVLAEMEHPLDTRFNYWVSDASEWVGNFDSSKLPLVAQYDYVSFSELLNE